MNECPVVRACGDPWALRVIEFHHMAGQRLTALHIEGLRSIADIKMGLGGLSVLVGENGSGKSSIIEAFELCRRIGSGGFLSELFSIHGGFANLLRRGAPGIRFTIFAELTPPGAPALVARYDLRILNRQGRPGFIEALEVNEFGRGGPRRIFESTQKGARVWKGAKPVSIDLTGSADLLLVELSGPLAPHPSIALMRDVLTSIEVHLPFEVTPMWASRAHQRPSSTRGSVVLQPAERLEMFGRNIANAFFSLRNERDREHWEATMDLVRLGLGGHIESVNTRADPNGGSLALAVKIVDRDELLPAFALSDGQLAYLCFVALYRLNQGRSLLAFDEPELHMHPELLVRVLQFFEDMSQRHPVVIATHSDTLLDALSEPTQSIRVCELVGSETRLRQFDQPGLQKWLTQYRGAGHIRSEGYLPALLEPDKAPSSAERAQAWARFEEGEHVERLKK